MRSILVHPADTATTQHTQHRETGKVAVVRETVSITDKLTTLTASVVPCILHK